MRCSFRFLLGLFLFGATSLGFVGGCYAPDLSRLLYSCEPATNACPEGMTCSSTLCVASNVSACKSGKGVWLNEEKTLAQCPNDAADFCADGYMSQKCPEESATVCPKGGTTTTCNLCCQKK